MCWERTPALHTHTHTPQQHDVEGQLIPIEMNTLVHEAESHPSRQEKAPHAR